MDLHSNPFASLIPQAVMDDHGTCNFNNRYILAVVRDSPKSQPQQATRSDQHKAGPPGNPNTPREGAGGGEALSKPDE